MNGAATLVLIMRRPLNVLTVRLGEGEELARLTVGVPVRRRGARGVRPAAIRLEFVHPRDSRVSLFFEPRMGPAMAPSKTARMARMAKKIGRARENIFTGALTAILWEDI
jgi:hypothetical protein